MIFLDNSLQTNQLYILPQATGWRWQRMELLLFHSHVQVERRREWADHNSIWLNRFERVVIGKYITHTEEMKSKRVKVETETEREDVIAYAHEVKQLSGSRTGISCEICNHECEVIQIPFIVSSVSYHSRKPNCELFDCMYIFLTKWIS